MRFGTLDVHLRMVWAEMDSVAFPGACGLLITIAVKLDDLQDIVIGPSVNTALEPFARLAFSAAPGFTAVPPGLLMVSTGDGPAGAAWATIGAAMTVAEAAAIAR